MNLALRNRFGSRSGSEHVSQDAAETRPTPMTSARSAHELFLENERRRDWPVFDPHTAGSEPSGPGSPDCGCVKMTWECGPPPRPGRRTPPRGGPPSTSAAPAWTPWTRDSPAAGRLGERGDGMKGKGKAELPARDAPPAWRSGGVGFVPTVGLPQPSSDVKLRPSRRGDPPRPTPARSPRRRRFEPARPLEKSGSIHEDPGERRGPVERPVQF